MDRNVIVGFVAVGLLASGCWWVYPPLALIVPGVIGLLVAALFDLDRSER